MKELRVSGTDAERRQLADDLALILDAHARGQLGLADITVGLLAGVLVATDETLPARLLRNHQGQS